MKYLEIIYNNLTNEILTTKIHNKIDTIIPNGYKMKIIPFIKDMRKNLDSKLFNGKEFILNPNLSIQPNKKEQFKELITIEDKIQFIAKELKLIEEK